MVTDARGHEVPTDSDMWGYREDMEDLSASIASVRSVADQAAAEAAIADLTASDIDPTGTVWWLANPGGLYAYDGTELAPLATAADLAAVKDNATKALARLPYAALTGSATSVGIAGGATKTVTVTYPTGYFTTAPQVTAVVYGTDPKTWAVTATTATTKSITFVIYNGAGVSRDGNVHWHAMQRSGPSLMAATAVVDDVEMRVVTCPTRWCENYDAPIEVPAAWTDDDGVAHPIDDVVCGVCGTNLDSTAEEGS